MPRVMNTFSAASSFNATGNPHAWNAPACNPKLSAALEKLIAESLIDLIPNDKALVPHENTPVGPHDWDGSFGLQKGLKTVKLGSGKEVKADFVFVGIGNRSNVELVEDLDQGALVDGQIWVDDYLRVRCLADASRSRGHLGLNQPTRSGRPTRCLSSVRTTTPPATAAQHQAGRLSREHSMTRLIVQSSETSRWTIERPLNTLSILCDVKGSVLKPYKRTEAHGMVSAPSSVSASHDLMSLSSCRLDRTKSLDMPRYPKWGTSCYQSGVSN